MRNIEYQQRMKECFRKAQEAQTEKTRKVWQQMADLWQQKAIKPPLRQRSFQELKQIGSRPTVTGGSANGLSATDACGKSRQSVIPI